MFSNLILIMKFILMEIEEEDRPKKPQVPIPMRWEVVHYKRLGYTGNQISQIFPVSASDCNRIYLKWKQTGDVEDLDRSGRPLIIRKKY